MAPPEGCEGGTSCPVSEQVTGKQVTNSPQGLNQGFGRTWEAWVHGGGTQRPAWGMKELRDESMF